MPASHSNEESICPANGSAKEASFSFKDSRGKWTICQEASTSTNGASWSIQIEEVITEAGREPDILSELFAESRKLNRVTSFSHSLQGCKGGNVLLTQHETHEHEEPALGAYGLRYILGIYSHAGATIYMDPSRNAKEMSQLEQLPNTPPNKAVLQRQPSEERLTSQRPPSDSVDEDEAEDDEPPQLVSDFETSDEEFDSDEELDEANVLEDEAEDDEPPQLASASETPDDEFDSDEESEKANELEGSQLHQGPTLSKSGRKQSDGDLSTRSPETLDLCKQFDKVINKSGRSAKQNRTLQQAKRAVTRTGNGGTQQGLAQ